MRDALGSEGIAGVVVILIAVGILTVHDPIVGGASCSCWPVSR